MNEKSEYNGFHTTGDHLSWRKTANILCGQCADNQPTAWDSAQLQYEQHILSQVLLIPNA